MFIPGSRIEFSIINALSRHRSELNKSIERLSTGSRINRASDDPSGLVAAENFRAALALLNTDLSTLERIDLIATTADAVLGEVVSLLIQAEGLQQANTNDAGLTAEEKDANDEAIRSIVDSVNRIFDDTTFLDQKLFDGNLNLETPAGGKLRLGKHSLGLWGETAEDRLEEIKDFRAIISTIRGEAGAFSRITVRSEERLIQVTVENLNAAESLIRDTDFAQETANLIRYQTLMEASILTLEFLRSQAKDILALFSRSIK